ncbi:MAG: AAA family ATPase, partial [Betaproteobacteria bacterium]|nr:AAA family ATPase [Betaproteobacteria bacterium]
MRAAIEAAQPVGEDSGDPSGITYRCMADVQPKPIRWLWPGRIARGKVSLIAGHPGLGKSQAAVSFAAIVSTGGLWPVDRTRCERGAVVILSAEDDPEDTIRPRLEAAGADLSRVYVLDAVREADERGEIQARAFNLATDISRLGVLLGNLRDVALIVIDPVSAYLGGVESHNNAEVRALLAPLAELAARHGVAVIAVSHLNKASGTEALLRVQGSIAFSAAARAVWGVARDKENPARRLFLPLKNNLGHDQTGLAFTVEEFRLLCGIETSRVGWEGHPVTITAEEA